MPTPSHHLQNVIDSFVSPAATVVGGAAASTTVTFWLTNWRDSFHANAQMFLDIGAYLTPFWLVIQMGCLLYVTFVRKEHEGED